MSTVNLALNLSDEQLERICTSKRWQQEMKIRMPFDSAGSLLRSAEIAFTKLRENDWLEAFAGHPMIGDLNSLKKKYSQGKDLSEKEQENVKQASTNVLQELLTLNREYHDKFGFIFIVCATNKTAEEMLNLLTGRIHNSRDEELHQAAIEQQKISNIRMEALL